MARNYFTNAIEKITKNVLTSVNFLKGENTVQEVKDEAAEYLLRTYYNQLDSVVYNFYKCNAYSIFSYDCWDSYEDCLVSAGAELLAWIMYKFDEKALAQTDIAYRRVISKNLKNVVRCSLRTELGKWNGTSSYYIAMANKIYKKGFSVLDETQEKDIEEFVSREKGCSVRGFKTLLEQAEFIELSASDDRMTMYVNGYEDGYQDAMEEKTFAETVENSLYQEMALNDDQDEDPARIFLDDHKEELAAMEKDMLQAMLWTVQQYGDLDKTIACKRFMETYGEQSEFRSRFARHIYRETMTHVRAILKHERYFV